MNMRQFLPENRGGFTLIELLVVVVIIGVLAAVAVPRFDSVRKLAYEAAVTSDLRGLNLAQELYFSRYQIYSNSLNDLLNNNYGISFGTSFLELNASQASGDLGWRWHARATHNVFTNIDCRVWGGGSPPTVNTGFAVNSPGSVTCIASNAGG